jgi:hypothetical protein
MHRTDRATLNPSAIEVADALDVLRFLHVRRNHRPIAETISTLLEIVRAHAGIALWPNSMPLPWAGKTSREARRAAIT